MILPHNWRPDRLLCLKGVKDQPRLVSHQVGVIDPSLAGILLTGGDDDSCCQNGSVIPDLEHDLDPVGQWCIQAELPSIALIVVKS